MYFQVTKFQLNILPRTSKLVGHCAILIVFLLMLFDDKFHHSTVVLEVFDQITIWHSILQLQHQRKAPLRQQARYLLHQRQVVRNYIITSLPLKRARSSIGAPVVLLTPHGCHPPC